MTKPLPLSLIVQWLGLCGFTAVGLGLIPGQGTKIPQALQCTQGKRIKKKKNSLILILNQASKTNSVKYYCHFMVLSFNQIWDGIMVPRSPGSKQEENREMRSLK